MGFFFNQTVAVAAKASSSRKKHIPIESMRELGCKACPLDKLEGQLKSPKMEPLGSPDAKIYVLGGSPSEDGDEENKPLAGEELRLLKGALPSGYYNDLRLHNIVQCHIPGFTNGFPREPEMIETECCRNYIIKDIEETKPSLILGLGPQALSWATSLSGGITQWRGRMLAVRIGNHDCWFYPTYHPAHVINRRKKFGKSEIELTFEHDVYAAIQAVEKRLVKPTIYSNKADYDRGIVSITGESKGDFNLLEDAFNRLAALPRNGIDLETSGLRPYHNNSRIFTAAVGTFDDTVAFALDHPEAGWSDRTRKNVHGLFLDYLLHSGRKIAHNLAFEQEWLAYHYGGKILRLTEWEDTMAQAHTIDERPGKSLDDLTKIHYGFFLKDQSRVVVKDGRILEFPLPEVLRYNGMDSKWCYKIFEDQEPTILANKDYVYEYQRKIRTQPTLVLSQLKGVAVDFEYTKDLKEQYVEKILKLERQINNCPEIKQYVRKHGSFSPTAPEQYSQLLSEIGREEIVKNDGRESSDESVLSKIPASEVPSAPLILEHRGLLKVTNGYLEPILSRKIISNDDRIHTLYKLMLAVSGRLASEDPNMQNFPKRKYLEVRGAIIPDGRYLACDYGQLEARIIGMATEDQNLVKYLWTKYDIHGFWADRIMAEYPRILDWLVSTFEINGDDPKVVRKTLRQEAKNKWVFPQFFGSHFKSCARDLHIPESVAEDLSKEFWDEFRGVKKWQDKLLKRYEKTLYVETLTGRRRRGAMTSNEIINHPIQGTGADIVLDAMNRLSEMADINEDPELQPNLNIHDDLTFDLENVHAKIDLIAREMCRHTFDFINVPLIVEASIGDNWNGLEPFGEYYSNDLFNIRNPYQ